MSNASQLLSTVSTEFSCLRVTEVPESGQVWETFHIWGWPPVQIVTGVPTVIGLISGKSVLALYLFLSFAFSRILTLFFSLSLSLSLSLSVSLLKDRSEPRRIKETPGALVTIPPKKEKKNRV